MQKRTSAKPIAVTSLIGAVENEVMPSNARRTSFVGGYFDVPAKRASRVYGTPVWRKPIQLVMPRRKRARSGIARDRIGGAAREQPEVAGVPRNVRGRDATEQEIEERDRSESQARLTLAVAANRVDDVEAFAPLRNEARNHLGRVLEIRVHEHDRVAARRVEPGGESRLVAEVAREAEQPQLRVACGELEQPRPGAVGRAVVDEDDLVRTAERRERRGEPSMELGERRLLVEDGRDDGEHGPHSCTASPKSRYPVSA